MIIVRALYVTKNDGASFINFLVETLYDIGYSPSTEDPDMWISPAMKDDGFQYC